MGFEPTLETTKVMP